MKPNYFKYLLSEKGGFLKDVAKKTGYSRAHVTLVLHGKRKNRAIQRALAKAIDLPVADVFPKAA